MNSLSRASSAKLAALLLVIRSSHHHHHLPLQLCLNLLSPPISPPFFFLNSIIAVFAHIFFPSFFQHWSIHFSILALFTQTFLTWVLIFLSFPPPPLILFLSFTTRLRALAYISAKKRKKNMYTKNTCNSVENLWKSTNNERKRGKRWNFFLYIIILHILENSIFVFLGREKFIKKKKGEDEKEFSEEYFNC